MRTGSQTCTRCKFREGVDRVVHTWESDFFRKFALLETSGVDYLWKSPVPMPYDLGTRCGSLASAFSLVTVAASGMAEILPPRALFPPASPLNVLTDKFFRVPSQKSHEDVMEPGDHILNKEIENRHGELWSRAYARKKRPPILRRMRWSYGQDHPSF